MFKKDPYLADPKSWGMLIQSDDPGKNLPDASSANIRQRLKLSVEEFVALAPEVRRCINHDGTQYGFKIDTDSNRYCSAVDLGTCPFQEPGPSTSRLPHCIKYKFHCYVSEEGE